VLGEGADLMEFRYLRDTDWRLSIPLLVDLPRAQRNAELKRLYNEGILLLATKPQSSQPTKPAIRQAQDEEVFEGTHGLSCPEKVTLLIPSFATTQSKVVLRRPPDDRSVRYQTDLSGLLGADKDVAAQASSHLANILETYRIFPGQVAVRVDIGRIILRNIPPAQISHAQQLSQFTASSVVAKLDEHKPKKQDPLSFLNIVTTKGGDANFVVSMESFEGVAPWKPSTRELLYEFICVTRTNSGRVAFTVTINGRDWTFDVRRLKESSKVLVHCPSRVFDFQVRADAAEDLRKHCGAFVGELIASLRIR
jgi:hypothetical protein